MTLPGGGAIAVGVSYAMYTSWGFSPAGERRGARMRFASRPSVDFQRGERGACPLERAVDRHHAGLKQRSDLGGWPTEHVSQDHYGALSHGRAADRGHERKTDAVLQRSELGRVARLSAHVFTAHRVPSSLP